MASVQFITTASYTLLSALNAAALPIVLVVIHKIIIERANLIENGKKPSFAIFIASLAFYIITTLTIIGLILMVFLKLQSIFHDNTTSNLIYIQYCHIFVSFYSKQNFLVVIILYLKLKKIFMKTSFKISKNQRRLFATSFIIIIMAFILVPTMDAIFPSTSIWRICTVIICGYNLTFMVMLSGLFIHKLYLTWKPAKEIEEDFQSELMFLLIKFSILAVLTIICTFISCICLISLYAIKIHSEYIEQFNHWSISINIYFNFLFITFLKKCYNKWYLNIFGCFHNLILSWNSIPEAPDASDEPEEVP